MINHSKIAGNQTWDGKIAIHMNPNFWGFMPLMHRIIINYYPSKIGWRRELAILENTATGGNKRQNYECDGRF